MFSIFLIKKINFIQVDDTVAQLKKINIRRELKIQLNKEEINNELLRNKV